MWRLGLILGIAGLFAGPANAQAVGEPAPAWAPGNPEQTTTHQMRLNRYVFDAVGQRADIGTLCVGAPATEVEVRRNAGDIALGILTLGWYVPAHVRVTCAPPPR
jgi:hypothetical protein